MTALIHAKPAQVPLSMGVWLTVLKIIIQIVSLYVNDVVEIVKPVKLQLIVLAAFQIIKLLLMELVKIVIRVVLPVTKLQLIVPAAFQIYKLLLMELVKIVIRVVLNALDHQIIIVFNVIVDIFWILKVNASNVHHSVNNAQIILKIVQFAF